MKQIIFLNLIILLFSYAKNACTGHQSKDECLNSNDGCCWFDSTFNGEPFRFCTENYGLGESDANNELYSYLDFNSPTTTCSSKTNKCLSIDGITDQSTKSDCLASNDDCCYLHFKYDVDTSGEYGEYLDYLNDFEFGMCMGNSYGTEKAFENSQNSMGVSTTTEGLGMDMKIKIEAKCKKSEPTFYSICYEQTDQDNCLQADSNCCWVRSKATATIGTTSSEAKLQSCVFNFFRNATTYKQYVKNTQNKVNSDTYVNAKYDVRCNMHDYALYGGSGKVVKDTGDAKISYDSDFGGNKGIAPLSKAVKNIKYVDSSNNLNRKNVIFAIILLALVL